MVHNCKSDKIAGPNYKMSKNKSKNKAWMTKTKTNLCNSRPQQKGGVKYEYVFSAAIHQMPQHKEQLF